MLKTEEWLLIRDLYSQGLNISEIAKETGFDRKTVRKYLQLKTLPEALEAAHIIPVNQNGADTIDNGICFRSDIHLLFDSGHLRIDSDGNLHLSDKAALPSNYGSLPSSIQLPSFVSLENIRWRWNYY